MNRLKEIKELKALAEELQLENREIIRKYKITELASIYNGIGPDSFPEWLRGRTCQYLQRHRSGFLSRMAERACFRPASESRCRGLYPRH